MFNQIQPFSNQYIVYDQIVASSASALNAIKSYYSVNRFICIHSMLLKQQHLDDVGGRQ